MKKLYGDIRYVNILIMDQVYPHDGVRNDGGRFLKIICLGKHFMLRC